MNGASEQEEQQESSMLVLRTLAGKEPSDEVRRRIVEGAFARRERRAPWGRAFTGFALAGAAAALAVVLLRPAPPAALSPAPVAALPEPAAGEVHEAGRFAVGPHVVDVATGGAVRFASVNADGAEMRVERGTATFDVDPLAPGQTFRVRTEQILVEVVGTRFEVGAEGSCSTVSVSEGRVRVTEPAGVRYLGIGESGRFCAPRPSPEGLGGAALVREAVSLVSRGTDLPRAEGLLERYRAEYSGGPFEEEALFYLTLVKDRLGDRDAASDLARTFHDRFPDSARAQRLQKWLDRTGH